MADDTTLQQDLKKLGFTTNIFTTMMVVVLAVVFSSSVWVNLRVVQLTHGLQRSNDKIATQQVRLDAQQKSLDAQQNALDATQRADKRANCISVNKGYAAQRVLVRAEAGVSVRQAAQLYHRSVEAGALNPPKNPQAIAARNLSLQLLRNLVNDTFQLQLKAIGDVDSKTKPEACGTS